MIERDYGDIMSNYAGLPVKYIVAGNYNEYQAYVKRKPRIEHYYKYVSGVEILRGLSSIDGFYIGSYKDRPDIDDIIVQIASIKSRMVWSDVKPARYQWTGDTTTTGVVAQEIGQLSDEFFKAFNGGDIKKYTAERLLKDSIEDHIHRYGINDTNTQ
jgi:hypothetical protein